MTPQTCIFFQLAKANQAAGRYLGKEVAELGITPVQALLLSFLAAQDRVTASSLGTRAELDSATLTGILDRLAAAELILRTSNPEDRRSIIIELTKHGRSIAAKAVKVIGQANDHFLAGLSQDERKELFGLLNRLRNQGNRL